MFTINTASLLIVATHLVTTFCENNETNVHTVPKACEIKKDYNGTCILIEDCDFAKNLLMIDRSYIQKINCGFEENMPKVCCPNSNSANDLIQFNKPEEASTIKPSSPSSVQPSPPAATVPVTLPYIDKDEESNTTTHAPEDNTAKEEESMSFSNTTSDVKMINPSYAYAPEDKTAKEEESMSFSNTTNDVKLGKPSYNSEKEGVNNKNNDSGKAPPPLPKPLDINGTKTLTNMSTPTEMIPPSSDDSFNLLPNKDECGRSSTVVDRIIGGTLAGIGEFPWVVRLIYKISHGTVFCSGTLISRQYVVTAAHCVTSSITYANITGVRLGEWDTESDPDCEGICNDPVIDVNVVETLVYPRSSKNTLSKDDIALLRLEHPVNFTDFIKPICLPLSEYVMKQDYVPEMSYTAVGWGRTEFERYSAILRKVNLKAVPMDICRILTPYLTEEISNYTICAGGSFGEDTCAGDSGGPLMRSVAEEYQRNWYLFGITSFGYKHCGGEGRPGLYTRVSKYVNWIKSCMRP